MHDPIGLQAYEPTALAELVRLLRRAEAGSDFGELASELERRDNLEPPGKRKKFATRVQRLTDLNAPELLVDFERWQADPHAYALEQLAKLREGIDDADETTLARSNLEAGVIRMCMTQALELADDRLYGDIAWWAGLDDRRFFGADDPAWNEDAYEAIKAAWESSAIRTVMSGTTRFEVDGIVVPFFVGHRKECWHAHDGIELAVRELSALRDGAPPPLDTFDRSSTGSLYRSMARGAGNDPNDVFPDLYAETVPKVQKLLGRLVAFYETCARRGWEVHITGEWV